MNNQQNGTHDKNEASNFGGKLVSVGIFLALVLLAVSSFFFKKFQPVTQPKTHRNVFFAANIRNYNTASDNY